MYQNWFITCDKHHKKLTIDENGFGAYGNSLYYLYNLFVNPKLFQNKMFT